MSFASEIKKELTTIDVEPCCAEAELSALIRMNGTLSLSKQKVTLDVQTENAAIARRTFSLLKMIYEPPVELLVRRKMKLKKNNVYIVRLVSDVLPLLRKLDIVHEGNTFNHTISKKYFKKSCCKQSYLRGAFLAGGSVNNPETSSYHLEIFNAHEEHNRSLCMLVNSFDLKSRELKRRSGYITYIKEAEKITEFLIVIGAHNALFKFEDVRIVRDMRNSVNRLVNCETANLNKTIGAAFRQVESIRIIDEAIGLDALPERLQEIAKLRMNNQEATLNEIVGMISGEKISKSGVNHRFKRLDKIAEKIKNGETVQ
ncbi:MAG TPA: DNA-binding protein WhiA [Bacillota bacterium]|nr:DNA-binding protein WhiA [Bacillota bacterium]